MTQSLPTEGTTGTLGTALHDLYGKSVGQEGLFSCSHAALRELAQA